MKIASSLFCFGIASVLIAANAPVMLAQNRDVAAYTRTDVRDLVQRMERHSDDFRKHFERRLIEVRSTAQTAKTGCDVGPRIWKTCLITSKTTTIMAAFAT